LKKEKLDEINQRKQEELEQFFAAKKRLKEKTLQEEMEIEDLIQSLGEKGMTGLLSLSS
jgi:hypothetical protein